MIASWDASSGEWWQESDIGLDRLEGIAVVDHHGEAARTAFGDLVVFAETVEEAQRSCSDQVPLETLTRCAGLTSIEDAFGDDQNGYLP